MQNKVQSLSLFLLPLHYFCSPTESGSGFGQAESVCLTRGSPGDALRFPPCPLQRAAGSRLQCGATDGAHWWGSTAAGGLWNMLEVCGWDRGCPWDIVTFDTCSLVSVLCSVTCKYRVYMEWYRPFYNQSRLNIWTLSGHIWSHWSVACQKMIHDIFVSSCH